MIKFGFLLLALCAFTGAYQPFRPRFDGRIVGGKDVDIKDYPHQLSFQYYGSHICGASIISEKWALTASHCVEAVSRSYESVSFRAGSSTVEQGGSVHKAVNCIMHPKYGNLDYDYALCEVDTPFPIGQSGVNKIALASEDPADNTLCIVTGWGTTSSGGSLPSHLKGVDVHIVGRQSCDQAYGSITDRMICAADPGKDSCQGDSGGPLVNKSTGELVGIVSWGAGCADPDYPGVYSDVAAGRDWIVKTAGL